MINLHNFQDTIDTIDDTLFLPVLGPVLVGVDYRREQYRYSKVDR